MIEFLRQRPGFFNDNPELLKLVVPPSRWSGDQVLDMQKFMVERLRDEAHDLREGATELISTTHANMMVQTRTHAAVLALLGADGLENLAGVIGSDLPLMLDVDAASICFEDGPGAELPGNQSQIRWLAPGRVDDLLGGAGEEVRLLETTGNGASTFGENSKPIGSAALARLNCGPEAPKGILALGASQEGSFHPSQSSELLNFLARVAENCVRRWLTPPA